MIDISVIVPAYNASKTIIKCLDSLKQSELNNYEVIVVDDVSTDNTVFLVEKYIDDGNDFVRLIKNSINQGPSFSRKNGIDNSRGSFLAFVDSDDYVETDFLDLLYYTAKNNNSDITVCDYFVVNEKGKKREKKVTVDYEIAEKKDRLLLSIDSFCLCFFNRDLFDGIIFPDIKNGEDMAVMPQLLEKANKVAFVSKPLYNYVYCKSSLSNAYSNDKVKSLITSFEIIYNTLGEKYPAEVEYLGIRNLVYGGMLAIFKHKNDKEHANRLLIDFESKYPNWDKSKYIDLLPFYKKVFVKNVKRRNWWMVRLLCTIHTMIA